MKLNYGAEMYTQVGKGSSEGKNEQRILTSIFVMGMFMWFKIAKKLKIQEAILEGRWYTGRKIHQIWAEWALCQLLSPKWLVICLVFCNFESNKHPQNKFWSHNSLFIFSLWATLANLGEELKVTVLIGIGDFPKKLVLKSWMCLGSLV